MITGTIDLQYEQHMDQLAIKIADMLNEQPLWDIMNVCAFLTASAITGSTNDPNERKDLLDRMTTFMAKLITQEQPKLS